MGCIFYCHRKKIWEPGQGVARALISQLTFFERFLECRSGIEEDSGDEFEVDPNQLKQFLLKLPNFGNEINTPAVLLRRPVAVLGIALYLCCGDHPEELANYYPFEIIEVARDIASRMEQSAR